MVKRLTIGDASLSLEDIKLLVPPSWINDQLITAAFELLRTQALPGDDRWLAVGPSEAFMMARLDDETQLSELFAPLKMASRQLVLFPVSDHDEPDYVGGTHWSLLAYYKHKDSAGAFYHFDSLADNNRLPAEHLTRRVAPLLGARDARVITPPTPQQVNGYDCGMYAIKIAEICVSHCGDAVDEVSEILHRQVTPELVKQRRKEMIRTLQAMMNALPPE